jgi:lysophospholipase L1-like esterase
MNEQGPRILAMGDSVTFGVGDGVQWPDGSSGWAAHVATSLGASRYINIAHNGIRARHLMASQVPLALSRQPDIVLMTVGGNDVLRGDFSAPEMRDCLHTVFARLSAPRREVVMVTLDRIDAFRVLGKRVAAVMNRRVDAANTAIRDACEGSDVLVVDGAEVFGTLGHRAWHMDHLHPSQLGHRAIASRAVEALASRWERVAEPLPERRAPALPMRAGWLAVYGTSWLAKRSIDLLPDLVGNVRRELRTQPPTEVREFA